MKIDFDIIDAVYELINQPQVTGLVDKIRNYESKPEDYSSKSSFITIGVLAMTADSMQDGVVNVNIYVPDRSDGFPDVNKIRTIVNAVYPLLEDGYVNEIATGINMQPKTFRDQDVVGYHFVNIRIKAYTPNVL